MLTGPKTGSFGTGFTPSPRSRTCRVHVSRQILFCTRRTEERHNHKWGNCETTSECDAGRALAEGDGDRSGRAEEATRVVDLNETLGLASGRGVILQSLWARFLGKSLADFCRPSQ